MLSLARNAGYDKAIFSTVIALLLTALFGSPLWAQPSSAGAGDVLVKYVSVMGASDAIEVEIQTSSGIVPESQTIPSPDRIVVDFPGALPAAELRSLTVNRGVLKAVRTGLFSAKPPITRVVLDLSQPQAYRISVNGNRVSLKLEMPSGAGSGSGTAVASAQPPATSAPTTSVNFQHGLLRIHAKGATLAEVLFEVQKQTGAEIPIPAGAEQEVVSADLGPAPAQDVLAALLNGSRYNFIFVNGSPNHSLQKAILSVR